MAETVHGRNRWADVFAPRALPRWENLPDFDLYMDQVISLLDNSLYGGKPELDKSDKQITHAMINNYVKIGLLDPPIKKKYNRAHIATLLIICVLKQALSIQEIKKFFSFGVTAETLPEIYNYFCEIRRESYIEMMRLIDILCDEREAPDDILHLCLFVSLFAVSGSEISQKLIALKAESIRGEQENGDKSEKKDDRREDKKDVRKAESA